MSDRISRGSKIRSWLNKHLFYDAFFMLREATFAGLQHLREMMEPLTSAFRKETVRLKVRGYVPYCEMLETRQLMTTSTWTGGGADNFWSTVANWSSGVPSSGDTVIINNSNSTVELDANVTIANLTMSAGTLNGSYTLSLTGSGSSWSGGTFAGFGSSSVVQVQSGATMAIAGNVILADFTLLNAGTVNWTGGDITVDNTAVLENNALFDVQTDSNIYTNSSASVINTGTFQKSSGSGTTDIQGDFTNSGTVEAQSGTLLFSAGVFTFEDGGLAVGVEFGGATVTVDTSDTGTAENVAITGGSLGGSGLLELTGSSTWSGGAFSGAGLSYVIQVQSGATLTITDNVTITDITFSNEGTVNWTGGDITVDNTAVLENNALFDVQTDSNIYTNSSASVINTGTFQKSSGSGTTDIQGDFTNSGTVEAQSGTLLFSAGVFTFEDGGLAVGVEFGGATVTVDTSDTGTAENVAITGGSLGGSGLLELTGSSTWSGGAFSGAGLSYVIQVQSGATLTITDNVTITDITFSNEGTVNWTGGDITVDNTAVLENNALFDVQTDSNIYTNSSASVINTGTFQKSSGSGTTDIQGDFTNSGTVEAQSGTLLFSAGVFTFEDGGLAVGVEFGGATVTVDTSDTGTAENVAITGGSLGGSGLLELTGSSTWSGGAFSGAGLSYVIQVQSGATLTITDNVTITDITFSNEGTVNWTGGDIAINSAATVNEFNGIFIMADGLNMTAASINSTLTNSGTLVVADRNGFGVNQLDVDFTQTSTGTIVVEIKELSGSKYDQLQIGGSATIDGTLDARALPGANIAATDAFPVLTSNSLSGTFATPHFIGFDRMANADYDSTNAYVVFAANAIAITGTSGALLSGNVHREIAAATDYSLFEEDTLYYYAGLEYNSDTASPQPLIGASITTTIGDPVPTQIIATLIWNGTPQTPVTFSVPNYAVAGDILDFTLQVAAPVGVTGVYDFTVNVEIDYAVASPVYGTFGGETFVVVNGANPYGNGWSLTDENYLYFANGNVYLVHGNGGYTKFAGSGGTFTFVSSSASYGGLSYESGTLAAGGGGYTFTAENQLQWRYDSTGLLTSVVNAAGVRVDYQYAGDVVTQVDEANGNWVEFNYAGDKLSSIIRHLVDSHSGHARYTTTVAYSGDNLTSVTDSAGNLRSFAYDGDGKILSDSNPGITFAYQEGALSSQTLGTSLGTTDVIPQLMPAFGNSATVSPSVVVRSQLYAEVTDGNGGTTSTQLDPNGMPLYRTLPSGASESWTRNREGLPLTHTDVNGNTTSTTYVPDTQRVSTVVTPDGRTATYAYGSTFNTPTAVVDGFGRTTTYQFDSNGAVTSTVSPDGVTLRNTYTTDLLQTSVDALGRTTSYAYDAHRRVTAIVDALGYTTTIDYDVVARTVTFVSPDGQTTVLTYNTQGQTTAQTDGNGFAVSQRYDANGNVTATVDPLGQTNYQRYDSGGRVTATVDAGGHTTRQFYDSANQVTASVDANGRTTYQKYDTSGRVTSSIDAAGVTTYQRYDNAGNVTATIDGNGKTARQLYSASGLLTQTIDATGATTQYAYDAERRLTAMVDASGQTMRQVYDSMGRVSATIDGGGHTSRVLYDAADRVTASVNASGVTSYQRYDAAGQVTATVDSNGKTALSSYDASGRLTASVDANGSTSYQRYDSNGQVTAIVNANGVTARQFYDAVGNLTKSVDYNSYTTLQTYDALGRLTQMIDNDGRTALYAYDAIGRLTQSIDVHGYTTQQFYDSVGLLTQTIDVTGHTWKQFYDTVGQLTMAIDGVGNTTKQIYDADGRFTATVDGNSHTFKTQYDSVGRVTATIDAEGATNRYLYDSVGNRTAVIDPVGNTSTMAYDENDRLTRSISATGKTTLQSYDSIGNLTQMIAPDASSIVIAYDAANRETQQVWYDPSHNVVDTQNRSYANNGQLATASNINGTYTFAYDAIGRVTQVQQPFGVTLNYAYDGNGNQTQVVDSHGGTQTSTYDLEYRLTSRKYTGQSQNLRVDYTYNAQGLVDSEKRYRDLAGTTLVAQSDYGYDANGRTTSMYSAGVNTYTYAYDAAGNLQSQVENTNITDYLYDDSNQLTQTAYWPGGIGPASINDYSFDAAGNRNMAGYATTTGNEMSSDGVWNYQYDLKGNITEKDLIGSNEKWMYKYDTRNQLVEAKHYDASTALVLTANYKYDIFGNRNEKTVNATTIRYVLDGWNPANPGRVGNENFNVFADLDGSSSLTTRYLYGDKTDELLARIEMGSPNKTYWLLRDRLSSTRNVIDNTGAIKDTIEYDGFGNITYELDPDYGGHYKYTGRQFDVESELQYNRGRYYNAKTGRWETQDPWGFDAGDSNLYRYVMNSPPNATDPSGLFDIPITRSQHAKLSPQEIADTQRRGDRYVFLDEPYIQYPPFPPINKKTSTLGFQQNEIPFDVTPRFEGPQIGSMSEGECQYWMDLYRKQQRNTALLWWWTDGATTLLGAAGGPGAVGIRSSSQTRPTLPNSTRGWRVGQPINNLTSAGNVPSWTTVRQRFWKNEAHSNPGNYNANNLGRMQRGLAPQRLNPRTGQLESMELHHTPPQREGGLFDVRPVWPDDHALIDPFRRTGN